MTESVAKIWYKETLTWHTCYVPPPVAAKDSPWWCMQLQHISLLHNYSPRSPARARVGPVVGSFSLVSLPSPGPRCVHMMSQCCDRGAPQLTPMLFVYGDIVALLRMLFLRLLHVCVCPSESVCTISGCESLWIPRDGSQWLRGSLQWRWLYL